MARRPRPAGDFCPRPFCSAQILFALRAMSPWALASKLCARPARTARSGGRRTLGRDLPGPVTSSVARRRRRSFPAFERLRSVPGGKDEGKDRGGWRGVDAVAKSFCERRGLRTSRQGSGASDFNRLAGSCERRQLHDSQLRGKLFPRTAPLRPATRDASPLRAEERRRAKSTQNSLPSLASTECRLPPRHRSAHPAWWPERAADGIGASE